jgi:hypothetical protein
MKKNGLVFLLGLLFIVSGCLDDEEGYSLNDIWIGFGMIEQVNSDPVEYRIVMDNGNVLVPLASAYNLPWYYMGTHDPESRLKTGDRVLLNYTVIGDDGANGENISEYYIRVNSVKKVLLKGILDITEENQDSIGNDPLIVREAWMAGGLLNFEVKYWGRYEVHYLNLVKQPGGLTAADQPIELELRHNANGDLEDIPYSAHVSFNLDQIQIEGLDSVQFRITATDYEGEQFEYEGTYNYDGSE